MKQIGIIGGGAWGTALAQALASAGKQVILWAREAEVVSSINEKHENTVYLSGVPLHKNISASGDLLAVTQAADILLIVTPAQHTRGILTQMKPALDQDKPLVLCTKGIEIDSGLLLSQIAQEISPTSPIAVLTGPNFAAEIARGLPSAATLAMKDKAAAENLAADLSSRSLRMYPSDDMIGAQIGGAVKNVIAIACGMIEGKKLGNSARAALITRGLAEIARLASALGAKKETLMGMCGVGDLLLTCSSMQSRNFSLGAELAQGKTFAEITASRNSVAEGATTSKALMAMAKSNAVEMPISTAVYQCLYEGARVDDMIEKMLDRPVKAESS